MAAIGLFFAAVSFAQMQPELWQPLGARLLAAVTDGDAAKTRALLDEWKGTGKPWPLGPQGEPLLFLAIEGREKTHPEIIEFLLGSGADVNARGPLGMTALHWAAANGYVERTEQILKHHPRLEATDDRGRAPLLVAHSDAAEKLLAAGASVLATDRDGMSALHYAAQSGTRHLDILFKAGFPIVDARSNAGVTPLHVAAVEGTESAARWLLDHGADLNAAVAADVDYLPHNLAPGYGCEIRMRRGATPLRLASIQNAKERRSSGRYRPVFELLSERGAKSAFFDEKTLTVVSALGVIPFAIAFFAALPFLDARVTGWHALAQRFAAVGEPARVNAHQNGGVGSVGLVYLKGLMRAAADERGFYFAFPKFLSAGHPPLHIPWSEMRVMSDKTLLGMRVVQLQVGEPKVSRIYLRGGVADSVIDRLRQEENQRLES